MSRKYMYVVKSEIKLNKEDRGRHLYVCIEYCSRNGLELCMQ